MRLARILLAASVSLMIMFFTGCGGTKYKVDYSGNKNVFSNAKDEYKEGSKVKLKIPISMDESTYVYVDGSRVNGFADRSSKYMVYKFTMPPHDIVISLQVVGSVPDPTREVLTLVPNTPPEYLVDYSERSEAVEGDGDSYGFRASNADGGILLEVFRSSDGKESKSSYLVPEDIVTDLYDIIDRYQMTGWKDLKDYDIMDGKTMVCWFYNEEARDHIRVSSEKMPGDGDRAFADLRNAAAYYMRAEYEIKEDNN